MDNKKTTFADQKLTQFRAMLETTRRDIRAIRKYRKLLNQMNALKDDTVSSWGPSFSRWGRDTEHVEIGFRLKEEHNRSNTFVLKLAKERRVRGVKSNEGDALAVTFDLGNSVKVVVRGYIPNTCTIVEEKKMVTHEEVTRRVVCTDAEGNVVGK